METQKGIWAVGTWTGSLAKSVQAHADSGIGYFMLESSGSRANPEVTAAFVYTGSLPLPEHLLEVRDTTKIREYERKRLNRMGMGETLINERLGKPPKNSFGGFAR